MGWGVVVPTFPSFLSRFRFFHMSFLHPLISVPEGPSSCSGASTFGFVGFWFPGSLTRRAEAGFVLYHVSGFGHVSCSFVRSSFLFFGQGEEGEAFL